MTFVNYDYSGKKFQSIKNDFKKNIYTDQHKRRVLQPVPAGSFLPTQTPSKARSSCRLAL